MMSELERFCCSSLSNWLFEGLVEIWACGIRTKTLLFKSEPANDQQSFKSSTQRDPGLFNPLLQKDISMRRSPKSSVEIFWENHERTWRQKELEKMNKTKEIFEILLWFLKNSVDFAWFYALVFCVGRNHGKRQALPAMDWAVCWTFSWAFCS